MTAKRDIRFAIFLCIAFNLLCTEGLSCDRVELVAAVSELFPKDGSVGICDDRCTWECSMKLNEILTLRPSCGILDEVVPYLRHIYPYCYERTHWGGIQAMPTPPFYLSVMANSSFSKEACTRKIREGESLIQFGRRYGLEWQIVLSLNPSLEVPMPLYDGHLLRESGAMTDDGMSGTDDTPVLNGRVLQANDSLTIGLTYRVQKGDSIYTVANRFGVTTELVVHQNPHIFEHRDFFGLLLFEGLDLCIAPFLQPLYCPKGPI
mmetsp:Transcript_15260/g.38527  ORF Transcript_15260/g.38527 Transcript_15260/m.38527 type:complete len:263 (-) Transcript_15260:831-1619(-)